MAGLESNKKRGEKSTPRLSRFSEVLGAAQQNSQIGGYPGIQPFEDSTTQPSENLAKRSHPDYTQTTFRIPKKLSRQINRVLMDLADEGVEVDRSDLLKELAGAFIRLAGEVGALEALKKLKNLGTQRDE